MKIKLKNIIIVAILLAISILPRINIYADEILSSMTVSPPTQKMILIPGETYTGALQVANSNDNKNDLKYSASIGSFSQTRDEEKNDDYGAVDHISRSNYNQIMDWIVLSKDSGVVPPNTTDILTYTINVPENAPAGGQYATIIVRDETGNDGSGAGNVAIQNVIQFASIIYAEVAGTTVERGKILDNSVPAISFGTPLIVSSMVKNEGNVHTDAKYTLQVWPLFSDTEIYSNEEEPKTSLILPGSERYNVQEWEEAPTIGIFRVKQTIELFGDVSTVEKIVVICPIWLILIIMLLIVGGVIWLILRRINRRKD